MKKKLFVIYVLLFFSGSKLSAQITLDTMMYCPIGLGYQFKAVQISSSETKWFFADTVNNTFNLYNMDFTPFITSIAVPEPFEPYYMQALYITRTLFDCDSSNIEYAYYSPLNNARPFRIVRTDGTILFQLDSANAPYAIGAILGGTDMIRPIINTSAGAKLFLQKYPTLQPIYVYSLCGTLPLDIFDFISLNREFVKVFPNPTSNSLTFQINPPDNINQYELVIIDAKGMEVSRMKINFNNDMYAADVSNFSNGLYYYSFCSKNKSYQTGKFIISK
ncbi:MAG: T9SS type A sorting domain-containing protein [Bacteroidota bacterium]